MTYLSKEHKTKIISNAKEFLKKHDIKATFSSEHDSIYCKLKKSKFDFVGNYGKMVKNYRTPLMISHFSGRYFSEECREIIDGLLNILNEENYDISDYVSDHHDVGWYAYIVINE